MRESLDLTLEEFGELVGIPWQTLHHYESGRAVPSGDRLIQIMHASRKAEKPFQVADRGARGSGGVRPAPRPVTVAYGRRIRIGKIVLDDHGLGLSPCISMASWATLATKGHGPTWPKRTKASHGCAACTRHLAYSAGAPRGESAHVNVGDPVAVIWTGFMGDGMAMMRTKVQTIPWKVSSSGYRAG